ncbi:HNH endonuclease [Enterobacter sp. PI-10]|uniref:HNH endonuclease n=1 Tax=Enterobacter sp. PI-10 TaxID=2899140 RepID=UPI00230066F1|nr:HNH endonuclease [Enterobacter sp. PI-10]MDA5605118.1 HNH endonuclease [Enterobacter sp. PI-10]
MPLMTQEQLDLLGAEAGAYSFVTAREATGDKSITLDSNEKKILATHYNLLNFSRRGTFQASHSEDRRLFYILNKKFNSFTEGYLLAVYPKSHGLELRLYMNKALDFYGNTGDIFIIYTRENFNYPVVGFIPQNTWHDFQNEIENNFIIRKTDINDEKYQTAILFSDASPRAERRILTPGRDVSKAKQALIRENYHCELDLSHKTFISPISGNPFMEAHHLIPLHSQDYFKTSLDNPLNIVSLCPNCHKMIHFGPRENKIEALNILYLRHQNAMNKYGVDFNLLCSLYGLKPR